MNDGTENRPTATEPSGKARSMWTNGRLVPFYCIMLSGVFLDIFYNWYSFYFAAECPESGNVMPPTFILFTAMSAIPATTSIIFSYNPFYRNSFVGIWLVYCLSTFSIAGQSLQFVNCYRDLGASQAVSILFIAFFSAIIIAITFAASIVILARRVFF
jgi:hypothetical protein